MRPPVGYLLNHPGGVEGAQGVGYDYVVAGNGVYVQAESELLTARVRVAGCEIRGLRPTTPKLHLPHGRVPPALLAMGIHWMQQKPDTERYFAIRWNGREYVPVIPEQSGTGASLRYKTPESAVMEFHSHCRMAAFFSQTDDHDEQGFRIYGVVGRLNRPQPTVALRVGVYGNFQEIQVPDVFEVDAGSLFAPEGLGERRAEN